MSRNQRRRDRIHAEIPIALLLSDLGYPVRVDASNREQQFPCDLHGDGRDVKPSARVYPDNNAWYCFQESKHRDAIQTIRDKFELSFSEALKWIEKKYNLPPMPFDEDDNRVPFVQDIDPGKTYEHDLARVSALMDNITKDRSLSMKTTASFWEAIDHLTYIFSKEQMDEN
ncbi:MAG: CHC2 zinc finger domain-containing protein, partial [Bacteroidota bacterium]